MYYIIGLLTSQTQNNCKSSLFTICVAHVVAAYVEHSNAVIYEVKDAALQGCFGLKAVVPLVQLHHAIL